MELIKKYSLLNFNYRFIILSIILFSSFFSLAQGEKINWMTFAEAIEAQKIKPKKILMDIYTTWCGPCKLMDKNTFQNPDVVNYVNQTDH